MLTGKVAKIKADTVEGEKVKSFDEKIGLEAEDLITKMTEAALKDRDLYQAKKPALNKLLMAP
jgi:hypothetical protein